MTSVLKMAVAASVTGLATVFLGAAPALAATLLTSTGTVLSSPSALDQAFWTTNAAGGYYYTFTTNETYTVNFTDTGTKGGAPVLTPFVIDTGATPGGTVLGASSGGPAGSTDTLTLAAGTYNLYIASTATGQAIAGDASVVTVPEPAAWSLLLLGAGGLGGALRSRRSATIAVA
jgi:hypothetical protein